MLIESKLRNNRLFILFIISIFDHLKLKTDLSLYNPEIKLTILVFYRLLLVSTLDGRLSALSIDEGTEKWSISTEPGPLLSSTIHHLEVSI